MSELKEKILEILSEHSHEWLADFEIERLLQEADIDAEDMYDVLSELRRERDIDHCDMYMKIDR